MCYTHGPIAHAEDQAERALRAELWMEEYSPAMSLVVNVSQHSADEMDRSSAWIAISRNGREEFSVAHMPPSQLKDGRMPECYWILTFRTHIGSLLIDDAARIEEEEEDDSASAKKRHFFPQPSSCDDRDDVVIGLAVALGVAGALIDLFSGQVFAAHPPLPRCRRPVRMLFSDLRRFRRCSTVSHPQQRWR